MSDDEVVRLLLQVTGAESLDDLKDKAQGAKSKLEELAGASDKAEGSTRNMGRATLEGGRILQDFAQGGLGGILNNIEGLATALGGGPGLAGIMTALGLAAYFAVPAVKAAWSAIVDGSNDVPEAADRLDGLSDSLATVNDRLKELRDKGWLTDSELDEYNDKLAKRVELEGKITAEKEKQAVFDKSRKASEEKDRDKESARIAQEIVDEAGGPNAVVARVAVPKILESQRSGELRKLMDDLVKLDEAIKKIDDAPWVVGAFNGTDLARQRESLVKRQRETVARSREIEDDVVSSTEDDVAGALEGDPEAAARMFANDPTAAARWNAATPGGLAYARRKKEAEELEKLDAQRRNKEADRQERLRQAEEKKDAEEQARAEKLFESQRNAKEARLSSHLQGADAANKAKAARDAAKAERDAETAARQAERDAEKAARENLPGNRLRAMREEAYQTAAGIAMNENRGEFTPEQLQGIARQAADATRSLDVGSIRQAVYQSAALTRMKIQRDLDAQMARMNYGGDPHAGF